MRRRLTSGEEQLARGLFGDGIDYGRVRIAVGRFGRTAYVGGSCIVFPPEPSPPDDFAAASVSMRAWFVHEMTHVWQFQNRPVRTLASWLLTVLRGGYRQERGYRYRWPFADWDTLNLEQQASMVEHAYMLREVGACIAAPKGATLASYRDCVPFLGDQTRRPAPT